MTNYIYIFHGGSKPATPAEQERVMAAWSGWLGGLGDAVVEPGAPFGPSKTVFDGHRVHDDGGANPASGYTIIKAASLDDAVAKSKGCPIFESGGSIEVCEVMAM